MRNACSLRTRLAVVSGSLTLAGLALFTGVPAACAESAKVGWSDSVALKLIRPGPGIMPIAVGGGIALAVIGLALAYWWNKRKVKVA